MLIVFINYPFLTCVSFIKDIENELICADDTSLYCDNHVVAADSLNEDQCLSPITLWVRIPLRRGILNTTLCDKFCQRLATGRWFSADTPVSSTNTTDSRDIAKILLKVALSTINQAKQLELFFLFCSA